MDRDGLTPVRSGRPIKTEVPPGVKVRNDAAGAGEADLAGWATHFRTDIEIFGPFSANRRELFAIYFPDTETFLLQSRSKFSLISDMSERGTEGLKLGGQVLVDRDGERRASHFGIGRGRGYV